MDFIEINRFTQDKKVNSSRNKMFNEKYLNKEDSLRLIIYACKKMYGINYTAKILHGVGVDKIKLSAEK